MPSIVRVVALLGLAGVAACSPETLPTEAEPAFAKGKPSTSTTLPPSQASMINIQLPGGANTFAVQDNIEYSFSDALALTYYGASYTVSLTNTDCKGGGSNLGQPCHAANNPGAPGAPTLTSEELAPYREDAVDANLCTFLNGGTLSGTSGTIVKKVARSGLNGNGTWEYTYTYVVTVAPSTSDPLAPKTAWTAQTSTNNARLQVQGNIAGLSYMQQSNGTHKYSFGLTTYDTMLGQIVSRIGPIKVELLGATSIDSQITNHTVRTNSPVAGDTINAVNFIFSWNTGANGGTTAQQTGVDARSLLNGTAGSPVDGFLGNNNGGADGSALQLAIVTPVQFDISAGGDYTVRMSANVKGTSASTTLSQAISSQTNIKVVGANSCK